MTQPPNKIPPETTALVHQLVAAVPSLAPLLAEHLNDYDELLPHVFFGDLTRFVCMTAVRDDPDADAIVAALESAMGSGSETVQELIGVSFLEDLRRGHPRAMYDAVRRRLGPNLRAELDLQEAWCP
jgi:hypothetical protein